MEKLVNKVVKIQLIGLDGNAFALLGAFSREARRQGWTKDEIKLVVDEATSGSYDHLLCVLATHTEPPEEAGSDYYGPDEGDIGDE